MRDERQITVWIVSALVLALILVFLFVWWLGERDDVAVLGTRDPAPATAPARIGTPSLTQPVVTAAPVDVPAAATSTPIPAPASASGAANAGARDDVEAAEAAAEPATAAVDAVASRAAIPATPAPRAEGSLALRMTFTSESWVEVTDARGDQLMYDLAAPGSTVELYPVPPARVLLGNAEGVDVTVDGRAFAIPSQGRRGNLANFVIRSQD